MIKQVIGLIGASVVAIIFKTEIGQMMHVLVNVHDHLLSFVSVVFANDKTGMLVQNTIALFLIPFLVGVVLSIIYGIIRRTKMPYVAHIVWVIWIVLVTLLVIQQTSVVVPTASTMNSEVS